MIKAHWSSLILAIGLLVGCAALSHAVAEDQNAPAPIAVPQAGNATPSNPTAQSDPATQSNSETQSDPATQSNSETQSNPATNSNSVTQSSPATQSNPATQLTTEDQAATPDQPGGHAPVQLDNAATQPPSAAPAPAPPGARVAADSSEYSVWKDTSLIGKVFIGVGALLTIASAAGMFMV